MTKRVVFISIPMTGYPKELIEANIERAKKVYLTITGLDISQVSFMDNLNCISPYDPEISKKSNHIWCLGNALKQLSHCDEAFFWGNWKKARGCMIEHEVCTLYDIPTISVEQGAYHG